jgi:cell division protein FtsB
MARLRKKNIWPLMRRGFSLGLLVLVTFFFARGAVRMYLRYDEASAASSAARQNLAELQEHKAQLETDTERLKSERGLEEELRKRYGVARPGEGVIEITEPAASSTQERPGALRRLLHWLF